MSETLPRRTFLRQLTALPLIGGAVTLIGTPTATAVPVTPNMLRTYSTWLNIERRWLALEIANGDREKFTALWRHTDLNNPAGNYHDDRHPYGGHPRPSTRAALVLSAVGCDWRKG